MAGPPSIEVGWCEPRHRLPARADHHPHTGSGPGRADLREQHPPRTPLFAPRIRSLNAQYADVAGRTGCTLSTCKVFTSDNLHLIEPGYEAWRDVLRPLIDPFSSSWYTEYLDL